MVACSCGESPHTRCAYCSSLIASRLRPTDSSDAIRPEVGITGDGSGWRCSVGATVPPRAPSIGERLAVLEREPGHADARLRFVAVDVEDRRLDHPRDIGE